jgi:acetoin:2,6-dichlorophenolindophenol oxidoreductase subunit alpha
MPNVDWTRDRLLDVYRTLATIRLVEESFVPGILDGTIRCPVHLYSGEEAVATGLCKALSPRDYVFGTHRSHGHFIAMGGALQDLVSEVYCRQTGCSHGRGGSMHLSDPENGMLGAAPIVAGTIALALGAALATQIRADGRVVVSFFGDGATGEGVLYEAMNFAAVKHLPLIFACENNLYSTHMPIGDIRVARPIAELANPFGIPTQRIDGNDVVAVHEAAADIVSARRRGDGPAFVEYLTYRLRGHVGPNDNIQGTQIDIRPAAEVEQWRARDPLPRFEAFVLKNSTVTGAELGQIREAIGQDITEAHRLAAASPRPAESEISHYVFQT